MKILETERLLLRTFEENDCDAMTLINQDHKVMEYFPSVADRKQTSNHIKRIMNHQEKYDYSLYAVEIKATQEMIGFVGLLHRTREEFDAHFMPSTEIGWRLAAQHWNQGYATEAAQRVLDYAFNHFNLSPWCFFICRKQFNSEKNGCEIAISPKSMMVIFFNISSMSMLLSLKSGWTMLGFIE